MARPYSRAKHPIVVLIADECANTTLIAISPTLRCFAGQYLGRLSDTAVDDVRAAARSAGFPEITS